MLFLPKKGEKLRRTRTADETGVISGDQEKKNTERESRELCRVDGSGRQVIENRRGEFKRAVDKL